MSKSKKVREKEDYYWHPIFNTLPNSLSLFYFHKISVRITRPKAILKYSNNLNLKNEKKR